MRFTVSQSALARTLAVVMKGSASNSTLPILSGVYIHAAEGTLEFQTTDLNISIRHRIPANVEEPGEVVISGKMISNIVKTLPDAAVTFESGDHQLSITSGKSSFHLNTLDVADFPEFPTFAMESSIELPASILSSMVDRVYKVASKDNSRPILKGILMTVEDNLIRLVATDSYRLVVCDTNIETSSLEGAFQMIIPSDVFHDVLSLPSDSSSILIGSTESQVVFVFGNTTYISRRIEGNFPNYHQLLPASCETSAKIKLDDFSAAMKRVSVIALSNPSVRFEVDSEQGTLTLSTTSTDQGDARESLSIEAAGPSLTIALNYHYVFDCVNALSSEDEVTLELQGPTQPGIFKSYSKINYLYLLMPVRM
ncbi:MAG: DNA polymerase III subunit beta [Atopobiaceae bacterium]|jgi:DNA polymerase-3 subunit beta|nr:DNA polymerase III subunit beta [Atopobiaceae bacterium]MCH4214121.1 DNA polymerase III subunit beta [Atopobiaceae bacterium]MCH4230480.1 DNA polymerase III subunit beta [Atopobiaceae bacterium]MCH4276473.1 DNA polymerase III subunit beta [Atopobiaceae bacterium]MCI1226275.1 DNA polymerase III subunit beta [Atopobiaceae bacterium]